LALAAGFALVAGFAFVAALALPDGTGTRLVVVGDLGFAEAAGALGFAVAVALALVLETGFLGSPTIAFLAVPFFVAAFLATGFLAVVFFAVAVVVVFLAGAAAFLTGAFLAAEEYFLAVVVLVLAAAAAVASALAFAIVRAVVGFFAEAGLTAVTLGLVAVVFATGFLVTGLVFSLASPARALGASLTFPEGPLGRLNTPFSLPEVMARLS